jgi:hypothetical protein
VAGDGRLFRLESGTRAADELTGERVRSLVRRALLLIAVLTAATGATQVVAPAFVLGRVGGTAAPLANHLFAIVGMFMVLFGGLLWQSLRAPSPIAVGVFWAALQKIGAAVAVALAVQRGLFLPLALLVAAFDLATGVAALWYWRQLRSAPGIAPRVP